LIYSSFDKSFDKKSILTILNVKNVKKRV